ncbi:MAG: class I SAM-dependent methyltransferase [Comamonas sp.]
MTEDRSNASLPTTPVTSPTPPTIDAVAAERWRVGAPALSPWLHEEIGQRMQERLGWIKRQPAAWADWSPLRGGLRTHAQVAQRYPQARAVLVESAEPLARAARELLAPQRSWWRRLASGPGPALEMVPDGRGLQVDMVWANMGLHTAAQPQRLMAQWHDALVPDGFLMFSCLGPDTARELRALYQAQGWPPPGHAFTDMHDWGDMLVQAGFAEPVMDMERIVLTYDSAARLLQELREIGRNLHPARFPALRGRGWRRALEQALAGGTGADPGAPAGGRLSLTFEVIYGHAFKAAPRVPVAGTSSIGLDDMRSLLRSGKKPVRPAS